MKIYKGIFRIRTNDGWKDVEGSYIKTYPFIIHRAADNGHTCGWAISHMATGHNIRKSVTLKHAKLMAKQLTSFPLFLVPTVETFMLQKNKLYHRDQDLYEQLMQIVRGDYNG